MTAIALAYAFAAGMAATVNPCGFVMLPTLISFYLGTREAGFESATAARRFAGGLSLGIMATLGFVVLFAIVGVIVTAGGRVLVASFPFVGLAIGGGLTILGIWLLVSGQSLGLGILHRIQPPRQRGPGGLFLFGVAYGAASLSCTLPIFLVVVGGALASAGMVGALLQFVSYALGMGVVLMVVSVATVLSKGLLIQAFRSFLPIVERVGAFMLVGAGLYLLVYWWPHLGSPLS